MNLRSFFHFVFFFLFFVSVASARRADMCGRGPHATTTMLAGVISKDGQILLYIGLFVLYVFIFVFWLIMFIDSIRNRNTQGKVWILVVGLAGFIGSLVYYFAVKRKRKRKVPTEPDLQDSGAYYLGGTTKDDVIKY
jgi:hypothetical protein